MENKLIEFIEFINSTCTIHQNKLHVDLIKKILHKRAKEYIGEIFDKRHVSLPKNKKQHKQQKDHSSFNDFDTF